MKYSELGREQLKKTYDEVKKEYESIKSEGLSLNMARGKPGKDQLELTMPMLDCISGSDPVFSFDGTDCRNYGVVDGIPEAKKLMGDLIGVRAENVIVYGNSSLNIMYDTVSRLYTFGTLGNTPWGKQPKVRFLCPAPGYDRHFAVTEHFGFELVPVPMTENGPDMDTVEELVRSDDSVKGIWIVPKYSNPQGYSVSKETVDRLVSMKTAAEDFRIFWDNAYVCHHLYNDEKTQTEIPEIFTEAEKYGTQDRIFEFCSTSKITFPGSGIAAMAASDANIKETKKHLAFQTIGYDKINQLRHVRFLKNADGIKEQMKKQADVIRPKFEAVLGTLDSELSGLDIGLWTKPLGGYFISFDTMNGCAKRTVALAKEAGMTMTGAGATFPYGNDPDDKNIRIAPTFPSLSDIGKAARLFAVCVKLAALEKLLG